MAGNTIAMYIDEEVAQRLFEIKKKHGKDHNITSASKLASVILGIVVGDNVADCAALDLWDARNG